MTELNDATIREHYELLTIIDSKASALLTFNGIFLAVLTVWLGYIPLNYLHLILDVVFLALLMSCFLLLLVVWLVWSKAVPAQATQDLESVRLQRTRRYHRAWWIAAISVVTVFAVSAVHSVGTGLKATGNCGPLCERIFSEKNFGNVDYSTQHQAD